MWFGRHVIADYSADPTLADRYADAMRSRFTGLRITIDDALASNEHKVPAQQA